MIDGAFTVKRYRVKDGAVVLQAEGCLRQRGC
jgi:hypothetical protein